MGNRRGRLINTYERHLDGIEKIEPRLLILSSRYDTIKSVLLW